MFFCIFEKRQNALQDRYQNEMNSKRGIALFTILHLLWKVCLSDGDVRSTLRRKNESLYRVEQLLLKTANARTNSYSRLSIGKVKPHAKHGRTSDPVPPPAKLSKRKEFAITDSVPMTSTSIIFSELHPFMEQMLDWSEKELKVFIYPIPKGIFIPSKNDWIPDHFHIEFLIPNYIRKAGLTTDNPKEADYFLIEHRFSAGYFNVKKTTPPYRNNPLDRNFQGNLDSIIYTHHMKPIMENVERLPYLKKNNGTDHLFIVACDFGPYEYLPSGLRQTFDKLKHASIIMNFNLANSSWKKSRYDHDSSLDLVVPQFHHWEPHLSLQPPNTSRCIDTIFTGTTHNNGPFSNGLRYKLEHLESDDEYSFESASLNTDSHFPSQSVFTLCPAGWAPWSLRLYDAISHLSIPVILINGAVEPFEKFLNWKLFTVKFNTDGLLGIVRNGTKLLSEGYSPNRSELLSNLHERSEQHRRWIKANKNMDNKQNYRQVSANSTSYLTQKWNFVREASEWLHWKETDKKGVSYKKNIWRLLVLDLWCRAKVRYFKDGKSIDKNIIQFCDRPDSTIAHESYW